MRVGSVLVTMKVKFGAVGIEVWKIVASIQRATLFRFIYHD
jgi:hypothetical protein